MFKLLIEYFKKLGEKREVHRNKSILEKFVHREYHLFIDDAARKNNQYLIDNITKRTDISHVVKNCDLVKGTIADTLDEMQHTYRLKKEDYSTYPYSESSDGIYKLTPRQFLRVYLLLESLGKKEFNKQIGTLLEEALNNPYSEDGGLVVFNENKELALYPIESAYANKKNPKYKNRYKMPKEYLLKLNILEYHFHVKEDCAGPSQGYVYMNPTTNQIKVYGDLAHCSWSAKLIGESHNIVITNLRDKKFNIDYYGAERTDKKTSEIIVVDLGNYEY